MVFKFMMFLIHIFQALMDLLDRVQLGYDTSDQDIKDIAEGEYSTHVHYKVISF